MPSAPRTSSETLRTNALIKKGLRLNLPSLMSSGFKLRTNALIKKGLRLMYLPFQDQKSLRTNALIKKGLRQGRKGRAWVNVIKNQRPD